jgi:hypothetical protein
MLLQNGLVSFDKNGTLFYSLRDNNAKIWYMTKTVDIASSMHDIYILDAASFFLIIYVTPQPAYFHAYVS